MYGMVIIIVIHSFNNDDLRNVMAMSLTFWDGWIREGVCGSCNAAYETYVAGQACLMSQLFLPFPGTFCRIISTMRAVVLEQIS